MPIYRSGMWPEVDNSESINYYDGVNTPLITSLMVGLLTDIKLKIDQVNSDGVVGNNPPTSIRDQGNLNIPLGGIFTLKLYDGTNPINATYKLVAGTASLRPKIDKPDDIKVGLWLDRVALLFKEGNATSSQQILAVHNGSQKLIITPTSNKYRPITLFLNVANPKSLGTASGQFDSIILQYAHLRGIPPQFIKAQIRQESNFDPAAFRYEPVSVDLALFGKNPVRDKTKEKIFGKYIIGPKRDLKAIHIDLLRPRNRYGVYLGSSPVPSAVPANYEMEYNNGKSLQSTELMRINNAGYKAKNKNETTFERQNWFLDQGKVAKEELILLNSGLRDPNSKSRFSPIFDFTAQTIVASSYGLMQPLYSTVANRKFANYLNADSTGRNPLDLFSPPTNLQYGTTFLSFVFRKSNGNENKEKASFDSFTVFRDAWKRGFIMYNAGPYITRIDISSTSSYGAKVWSHISKYEPVAANPFVSK
ncbi:lytic transglycosylase domain-containing protein [Bdellovibrio bacteriovorus]|uniref:Putative Lytic Transglycosylase n=1 Tax=Bdellovibrio bacteriovorus str. Tiberius TaxID=1069642 RepID=K7ZBB6_BDEBC|nr:lytic transglycosylase domain-containing protein [Bdellovibrio bacteriovorus]AFY02229.1 Putative Lytic Transglycosylase [Bdellovibrio bacteriovorus str. Tiberius]